MAYSPVFRKQKWHRFHIKDSEKGPVVWEAKFGTFYRKQGEQGLPRDAHTLVISRNVLDPNEVKYFLTNMSIGKEKVSLDWVLWVAFSRWPIERCFEIGKRDLGFDHFEVRSWNAIHRHFYISQLSQLFCARVQQSLMKKNSRKPEPDSRTSTLSCISLDYQSMVELNH